MADKDPQSQSSSIGKICFYILLTLTVVTRVTDDSVSLEEQPKTFFYRSLEVNLLDLATSSEQRKVESIAGKVNLYFIVNRLSFEYNSNYTKDIFNVSVFLMYHIYVSCRCRCCFFYSEIVCINTQIQEKCGSCMKARLNGPRRLKVTKLIRVCMAFRVEKIIFFDLYRFQSMK